MADESTARIVTRTEHNEATSFRDHGGGDPVEQPAVTDRPNDLVAGKVANTTFADRAKAQRRASTKAVASDETEDKAVSRSERKSKGRR